MTYRDDLGALRSRLTNLEQEQAALRAKKRELDEATARLSDVDTEVADLRDRIKLPLLDTVKIASPCPANWDDMVGDERVRFCGRCEKNVYNVVELTRAEAEDVIREHEGDVCMRLYQRKDGMILTADCPVGVKRKRRRRMVAGALLTASAGLGVSAMVATPMMGAIEGQAHAHSLGSVELEHPEEYHEVAGGISSGWPEEPPPPDSTATPDATKR